MSIGDAEIKTQERVIRFFKDPEILGYQYIGNLSDYRNKNINEDRAPVPSTEGLCRQAD